MAAVLRCWPSHQDDTCIEPSKVSAILMNATGPLKFALQLALMRFALLKETEAEGETVLETALACGAFRFVFLCVFPLSEFAIPEADRARSAFAFFRVLLCLGETGVVGWCVGAVGRSCPKRCEVVFAAPRQPGVRCFDFLKAPLHCQTSCQNRRRTSTREVQ